MSPTTLYCVIDYLNQLVHTKYKYLNDSVNVFKHYFSPQTEILPPFWVTVVRPESRLTVTSWYCSIPFSTT